MDAEDTAEDGESFGGGGAEEVESEEVEREEEGVARVGEPKEEVGLAVGELDVLTVRWVSGRERSGRGTHASSVWRV